MSANEPVVVWENDDKWVPEQRSTVTWAGAVIGTPQEATTAMSRVSDDRRYHAVGAHLQEMSGDRRAARASYEAAERAAARCSADRSVHGRWTVDNARLDIRV
jgi:hypothetical protein